MKLANLSYAYCMYIHNLLSLSIQNSWTAAKDTKGTDDEFRSRYGPCCCHQKPQTSTTCQSKWASRSQYEAVSRSPSAPDIWPTKKILIS
ncbi:hypothetical protein M9H77_01741 [Catharanthus roseus]|uniref:Uncharacterized protein n=1 Tax=Catharanthus roseus TaxID=4058 RepID=A0ACC0C6J5_CATRO|nr:hypothetical protein M9H77_01741 [Catharanthus roseus]